MIDLEEIMLQEEVGKNEKGINIEDGDTREWNKDSYVENDIKMSKPPVCESKKA